MSISHEQKVQFCVTECTLNGSRARVCGCRKEVATVRDYKSGLSAEWSWTDVARILSAGGEFKTD